MKNYPKPLFGVIQVERGCAGGDWYADEYRVLISDDPNRYMYDETWWVSSSKMFLAVDPNDILKELIK